MSLNHKYVLINAIRLEMELIGEKGKERKIGNLFHSPREMLEMAIEQFQMKHPQLIDVIRYIEKTQLELMIEARFVETRRRLIELIWRIEKEWKFCEFKN